MDIKMAEKRGRYEFEELISEFKAEICRLKLEIQKRDAKIRSLQRKLDSGGTE